MSRKWIGVIAACVLAMLTLRLVAQAPAASRLRDIAVFDRQGTLLLRVSEDAPINIVSISPDGKRVAYSPAGDRVMVLDVASRARMQIAEGYSPVGWSPDGSRITHLSRRSGALGIYVTSSTGGGEDDLLTTGLNGIYHWTADGRFIVAGQGSDFVAVSVSGATGPIPFLSQQQGSGPRISPDNRFLAYTGTEGGGRGMWVRPLTLGAVADVPTAPRWKVSSGDGLGMARWRGDSRELYYIAANGDVMAVPIGDGPEFSSGTPVRLFRTPVEFPLNNVVGQHADVSANGERFVFLLAAPN